MLHDLPYRKDARQLLSEESRPYRRLSGYHISTLGERKTETTDKPVADFDEEQEISGYQRGMRKTIRDEENHERSLNMHTEGRIIVNSPYLSRL